MHGGRGQGLGQGPSGGHTAAKGQAGEVNRQGQGALGRQEDPSAWVAARPPPRLAHRLTSTPCPAPILPPSISTSFTSHSPISHWQVIQVAHALSCAHKNIGEGSGGQAVERGAGAVGVASSQAGAWEGLEPSAQRPRCQPKQRPSPGRTAPAWASKTSQQRPGEASRGTANAGCRPSPPGCHAGWSAVR